MALYIYISFHSDTTHSTLIPICKTIFITYSPSSSEYGLLKWNANGGTNVTSLPAPSSQIDADFSSSPANISAVERNSNRPWFWRRLLSPGRVNLACKAFSVTSIPISYLGGAHSVKSERPQEHVYFGSRDDYPRAVNMAYSDGRWIFLSLVPAQEWMVVKDYSKCFPDSPLDISCAWWSTPSIGSIRCARIRCMHPLLFEPLSA